jgi:hypothetical protein
MADEDVSVPRGGGADPGRGTERFSERMTERFFGFISIPFCVNINSFSILCPNPVSDPMP